MEVSNFGFIAPFLNQRSWVETGGQISHFDPVKFKRGWAECLCSAQNQTSGVLLTVATRVESSAAVKEDTSKTYLGRAALIIRFSYYYYKR